MTALRDGLSLAFAFVPKLLLIGCLIADVLRKTFNAILDTGQGSEEQLWVGTQTRETGRARLGTPADDATTRWRQETERNGRSSAERRRASQG